MNTASTDPIQRIEKVVSNGLKLGRRRSDAMLLNEYMRRLSRLEQHTHIQVSGLFFDPLELSGASEVRLKQERLALATLTEAVGNRLWARLLQNYVLWTILVRQGNIVAAAEPDLFEPLMRMFERGSAFIQHHGEAQFEKHAVPLQTWRHSALRKPIEIDEDKLLQWDE